MAKAVVIALVTLLALPAQAARIKELVEVQGVRDNELFGYGLVVGLQGTGDNERVLFTMQSIAGMLGRLGTRIDPKEIRVRNVAAVMVTAKLATFARPGTRIDVQVASMGNARSLQGGVLLLTPLNGPDGKVYGVAQGALQIGGFEASQAGSLERKNTTNSGRIPQGATVERSVIPDLAAGPLTLELKRADFTTALRIAQAVNTALGADSAQALDPAAVQVKLPKDSTAVQTLAKLEALEVEADMRAKIVVSERTGTIVAGDKVRIRPVAVAQGGLRISVVATPQVSQPNAFGQGQTVVTQTAQIKADEGSKPIVSLPATTTIDELCKALNMVGASPRDLIAILQAMKVAGALDADLEVM